MEMHQSIIAYKTLNTFWFILCGLLQNTGIVEDRGGVPKGSRTSEYYRTKSIPDRFDNPGQYQGQNEFTLSSQPTGISLMKS